MQTPKKYSNIDDIIKDAIVFEKHGFDVCCVVESDIALEYILKFINLGYKPTFIDYDNFDYIGEYYIGINDNNIYVEKVWHLREDEDICYANDCDMLYFHDKCNKEILNHIQTIGKTIFIIE